MPPPTSFRVGFHSVVPFNREHFGVTLGLLIFNGAVCLYPPKESQVYNCTLFFRSMFWTTKNTDTFGHQ